VSLRGGDVTIGVELKTTSSRRYFEIAGLDVLYWIRKTNQQIRDHGS
jgi:hypothetical protein